MPLTSPIQGTIVAIEVGSGESVRAGEPVVIVEAMKMEHVISADFDGVIVEIIMQPGDVVKEGFPILFMQEGEVAAGEKATKETLDPDLIRQDLQENINRHAFIFDENRDCLLYTSPSPRDGLLSRMPSSA